MDYINKPARRGMITGANECDGIVILYWEDNNGALHSTYEKKTTIKRSTKKLWKILNYKARKYHG